MKRWHTGHIFSSQQIASAKIVENCSNCLSCVPNSRVTFFTLLNMIGSPKEKEYLHCSQCTERARGVWDMFELHFDLFQIYVIADIFYVLKHLCVRVSVYLARCVCSQTCCWRVSFWLATVYDCQFVLRDFFL